VRVLARSPDPLAQPVTTPRVLIVDDSRAQRRILALSLARWGYAVDEAASGGQALQMCKAAAYDIVISDWMMPGMTGLEFCKAFRAIPNDTYGYFILLTSKSEKAEVAGGLEGGADDFLTKPVNADELRARLRAGERILSMQHQLVEKNRLVGSTLNELQKVYDLLDRDLLEAKKLQQTLVRDRFRDFGGGTAALLIRPSGHVGGDLAGWFRINDRRIGLYSVDVAGHGVASAMMTARLAGLFSGDSPDQNVALKVDGDGRRDAWPPETVAERLNRMMIEDLQVDQYFTLAYADVDLITGLVALVQAGHPHPTAVRGGLKAESLGTGGLPIGLIPGATYDRTETQLQPGDRLFLASDGITECPNMAAEEFGGEGLQRFLTDHAGLALPDLLEALIWRLADFHGSAEFPDDVSGLVFDYTGP